jgi:hypothetical protein
MRTLTVVAVVVFTAVVGQGHADESADARKLWVYEGGWFARIQGDVWYELNEEVYSRQRKPFEFREVKRTREYVELYDAIRQVTVRLSDAALEARWDADGQDAEWKQLYKGRWKKPASE